MFLMSDISEILFVHVQCRLIYRSIHKYKNLEHGEAFNLDFVKYIYLF